MLFRGITIISAVTTLAVYLLGYNGNMIFAIPIFISCFGGLFLIWVVSCALFTVFIRKDKPCMKHNPVYRFYANCIIDSLLQLLRVKLHITGLEKLPQKKFLMVGNHKSSMDPILEMGVLRKYCIGFVAKKELFDIPVIGKIMHKCFCLSLDRENLRDEVNTIIRAVNIIKSGEASIGIYPEGRRNKGIGLLPFKAGAFKIAQKAECPIVIGVISNSETIMKNAPFRKTDVYIDFIDTLDINYVRNNSTMQISKRVYEQIKDYLSL